MKNASPSLLAALAAGLLLALSASAQNVSTADRALYAIRQRYNDCSGAKLDDRGYALRPELNLIPGVRLVDVRNDFLQGSGNELDGKFCAAHSSSALAANSFGPWRIFPQSLRLLDQTDFDFLQFEKQCPTGLGGTPPNLDLLVSNPDVVVGVESKFLEFLAPKKPKFSPSYARESLPQAEDAWWNLLVELKDGPEQYLDAAQLVRHYLGLRNQPEFAGKKIVLLYVFWEPENWSDFPEYVQHRKEIAAFAEKVLNSEVEFAWLSYPELWAQWESLNVNPGHVREIRKRYLLAI